MRVRLFLYIDLQFLPLEYSAHSTWGHIRDSNLETHVLFVFRSCFSAMISDERTAASTRRVAYRDDDVERARFLAASEHDNFKQRRGIC